MQTCFNCHQPGFAVEDCSVRHAAISEVDQVIVREAVLSTVVESQSSHVTHVSEPDSQMVNEASAPRSYADMVWDFEGILGEDVNPNDGEEFLHNKRDRSNDKSSQLHADKRGRPEMDSQSQDLFWCPRTSVVLVMSIMTRQIVRILITV